MKPVLTLIAVIGIAYSALAEIGRYKNGYGVVHAWKKLITDNSSAPVNQKLKLTNRFFNRHIHFSNDMDTWGQKDYWATPGETLSRGQGDCEDYVLAKYSTLLGMNVPVEQLRLIYVIASDLGNTNKRAHMVLGYYPTPDAEPLILDNLISDIHPASLRIDLTPIFSFNSEGVWQRNGSMTNQPSAKLSPWRNVLHRIESQGLPGLARNDQ